MTAREGLLEAEKLGLSKEQLSRILPIVDATSSDSGMKHNVSVLYDAQLHLANENCLSIFQKLITWKKC
jgi:uncharacterized protein YtpQ (UPF0354 family)